MSIVALRTCCAVHAWVGWCARPRGPRAATPHGRGRTRRLAEPRPWGLDEVARPHPFVVVLDGRRPALTTTIFVANATHVLLNRPLVSMNMLGAQQASSPRHSQTRLIAGGSRRPTRSSRAAAAKRRPTASRSPGSTTASRSLAMRRGSWRTARLRASQTTRRNRPESTGSRMEALGHVHLRASGSSHIRMFQQKLA